MKSANTPNKPSATWEVGLALLAGLYSGYRLVIRPRVLTLGMTKAELEAHHTGDDLILTPQLVVSHAIQIDAPLETVWGWVAQLGREDVGWYAWDSVANHGIQSATQLRPNLASPTIGLTLDNGWRVLKCVPPCEYVVGGFALPTPLGVTHDLTLSYQLKSESPHVTRLIWRLRLYAEGMAGLTYANLVEFWYLGFVQKHLPALADRAMINK